MALCISAWIFASVTVRPACGRALRIPRHVHEGRHERLLRRHAERRARDGNLIYETNSDNDLDGIEISDEGHYSDLSAPENSYNTITNNVVYGHNLGIVFWYSGKWSSQALNDQSGLRSLMRLARRDASHGWDPTRSRLLRVGELDANAALEGQHPDFVPGDAG